MKTSILTKHFEIRSYMYELLLDLAIFSRGVISVHNEHLARAYLKYTLGSGKWIHIDKYEHALELFKTHNVSYTIGHDATRGGALGDYIDVPSLALSDFILTLKHNAMLTVEQWSSLSLNDRRNYIVTMCTLGALAIRNTKQLSYARLLLDEDCDNIAERVMQNPIEAKIYFLEVNTNE